MSEIDIPTRILVSQRKAIEIWKTVKIAHIRRVRHLKNYGNNPPNRIIVQESCEKEKLKTVYESSQKQCDSFRRCLLIVQFPQYRSDAMEALFIARKDFSIKNRDNKSIRRSGPSRPKTER
jgi:hypothetical protein